MLTVELEPFNRHKVKPGDLLIATSNHDIRMRFAGFGHFGQLIAHLEDGVMPEHKPRCIILRQKDCGIPLKPNSQPSTGETT